MKTIAVIGAGECDSSTAAIAEQAGFLLAQQDFRVICGGLGGVMESVCKGAKRAGGTTIGILPGDDPADANPYVDIAIATGIGIARNSIIIRSCSAVLAIDGKFGTLSEIAYALQLGKAVVGLNSWQVSEKIIHCKSAEQAVQKIKEIVSDDSGG